MHIKIVVVNMRIFFNSKNFAVGVTVFMEIKFFQAHKSVLSASSPYFRAMFSAGLKEQEQKSVEIHLLSGPIFKVLVDFIYSGNVEITSNNVQDLLVAADMLQLAEVIDLSTSFLEREIDVTNALGIYRSALKLINNSLGIAEGGFQLLGWQALWDAKRSS